MPHLTDTEWRLLCVIVRQTLGWRDAATGGRKERDWLTQAQLIRRTGRSGKPVSQAVDTLVTRGLIRVLSEQGRPLLTPAERRRYQGQHWFQLHPQWAEAIKKGEESLREGKPQEGKPQEGKPRRDGGGDDRADSSDAPTSGEEMAYKLYHGLSAVEKVHTTKESVNKRNFYINKQALSSGKSTQVKMAAKASGMKSVQVGSLRARHSSNPAATCLETTSQVPASRPISTPCLSTPCLSLDDVLTVFGPSEPIIRQTTRQRPQDPREDPQDVLKDVLKDVLEDQPGHRWKWSRDKQLWVAQEEG